MKAKLGFNLVVIVGTVMTAWTAMAQQPGVPDGQGQHRPKPPLMRALDANGDGIIDASEIANAAAALKALDKNGDGKLTADEFMPERRMDGTGPGGQSGDSKKEKGGPGGKGGRGVQGMHHPKPPLMAALDANGDGTIDASEIANAPAALKALDRNGDGKLTPDEYRPPRPEGQGGVNGPSSGSEESRKP